jgi:hypothetical protein
MLHAKHRISRADFIVNYVQKQVFASKVVREWDWLALRWLRKWWFSPLGGLERSCLKKPER